MVREDNPARVGESRRFEYDGRHESLRRYGESRGHHRGLRAGHAHTGVVWELERTAISLRRIPGWANRYTREARRWPGELHLLASAANESGSTQGIGDRAQGEETRDGEAVVLADHSTEGRSSGKAAKVGNLSLRDPLKGR